MVLRYMDNNKNDSYYMNKALLDINTIITYSNKKTYDEVINDGQLVDTIMFRLIQLVENIKNISREFKAEHHEIPWGDIIGFRNGIVHEYGETDYTTVYEIITKDIYQLKELFECCL